MNTTTPPKRGRPRLPKGQLAVMLTFRIPEVDLERMALVAAKNLQTPKEWLLASIRKHYKQLKASDKA